jgi:hypothetical protein
MRKKPQINLDGFEERQKRRIERRLLERRRPRPARKTVSSQPVTRENEAEVLKVLLTTDAPTKQRLLQSLWDAVSSTGVQRWRPKHRACFGLLCRVNSQWWIGHFERRGFRLVAAKEVRKSDLSKCSAGPQCSADLIRTENEGRAAEISRLHDEESRTSPSRERKTMNGRPITILICVEDASGLPIMVPHGTPVFVVLRDRETGRLLPRSWEDLMRVDEGGPHTDVVKAKREAWEIHDRVLSRLFWMGTDDPDNRPPAIEPLIAGDAATLYWEARREEAIRAGLSTQVAVAELARLRDQIV